MDLPAVEQYLKGLQQSICDELSTIDGSAHFEIESWERPEGGGGISRVLVDGNVFEKGGVNFSYVEGGQMPGSATQHRPELAGRSFKAMGVSLVMHPQNPYVPTSHANVRPMLTCGDSNAKPPGRDVDRYRTVSHARPRPRHHTRALPAKPPDTLRRAPPSHKHTTTTTSD